MPGLLSRLKKVKRSKEDSVEDVLRTESSKSEAEQLLDDLLEETAAPKRQESVVIRRKSPKKKGTSSRLPEWMLKGKSDNPDLDTLMHVAVSFLNQLKLDASRPPVEELVPLVTQRAIESLRDDSRVNKAIREAAEQELFGLLGGKSILEPLFEDQEVTDVVIDSHSQVRAVRQGLTTDTPFMFRSAEEYGIFIDSVLESERISPATPIVEGRLDDQWRTNFSVIDPSLLEGEEPKISFHIPRLNRVTFFDLLQRKMLPPTLASWLAEVVASREVNILIVGAKGSGKTALTTALLNNIGSDERVILVEDVPEISLSGGHMERLLSSPAAGASELIAAALKHAPHRLVVGELKGQESTPFLRVLEGGLAGSIATITSDSGIDGLWRFVDLLEPSESSPLEGLLRRVGRAIDLVVVMRKIDGKPCLVELSELQGVSEGDFNLLPLACYLGSESGKRQWQLLRQHSRWIDYIEEAFGVSLAPGPGLVGS